MFGAENIRDWREHDVIDQDGKKIGQLEAVYVDTGTDEPELLDHSLLYALTSGRRQAPPTAR